METTCLASLPLLSYIQALPPLALPNSSEGSFDYIVKSDLKLTIFPPQPPEF